ncbi:NADH-dependent phenylglyoxylate dehydrogenase subunit epsilon [subsurface metagenome]
MIASGASPKVPPQQGMNGKNVYTIRNFSDIGEIYHKLDKIKDCVFLGGGMVSLKVAQALKRRGVKVTVVVSGDHIISQRLDKVGAQIVADYLKSKNIQIITNETAREIINYRNRKLIYFSSGKKIETDMIIVGKGVTPNCNFIDRNQVKINQGIVVDDYLKTSAVDVFAAGDVVESQDLLYQKFRLNPILPNAVKQGRIAALNMMGVKCSYRGNIDMNSIQLFDLPIISIGLVKNQNNQFEEITHHDSYNNTYKRLLFDGDLLVGVIMIGDIRNAGIYHQIIENKKRIKEKKELLNSKFNLLKYMKIPKEGIYAN